MPLAIGIVGVLGVSSYALADVYEYQVAKVRIYEQADASAPTMPEAYVLDSYIDTDDSDATSASLSGMSMDELFSGEWELSAEFPTQVALDAAFPGFTFSMHLEGGTLGTRNETVILSSPAIYPIIPALTEASFNASQSADSTQNLLLEWNAPGANTNLIFLSIYDSVDDIDIFDGDLPSSQTSYLVPESALVPGRTYEVEIAFGNVSIQSGQPSPGFGSSSDEVSGYASVTTLSFTTQLGQINLDSGVFKVAQHTQTLNDTVPGSAESWSFEAFFDAGIGSMTMGDVTGGAFPAVLFEYEPGQWDADDEIFEYESKGLFDSDFPNNTIYTMNVDGGTLGARAQDFFVGSEGYPIPGYFDGTTFDDLQGLDTTQDLIITWSPPDPSVNLIAIGIDRSDTFATAYEGIFQPTTAQLLIPAGTLESNQQYEIFLTFVNMTQSTGDGFPGFDTDTSVLSGFLVDTYVSFTTASDACAGDFTGDGRLNFFDISAFISLLAMEDPAADINNDDRFNFFDISAFLSLFAAGCP